MYSRQRVNEMEPGRQGFIPHFAEEIDDSNVAGRDYARGARQEEKQNNKNNEKDGGARFHERDCKGLPTSKSKHLM